MRRIIEEDTPLLSVNGLNNLVSKLVSNDGPSGKLGSHMSIA